MILSKKSISKEIENKNITIKDFKEGNLKTASYSLTLGEFLFIPKLENEPVSLKAQPTYTKIRIDSNGYILKPNRFILGQSSEEIGTNGNIAAMLDTRTSLAKLGVSMLLNSIFIQPNQSPIKQTLEIVNHSRNNILLENGAKVVKVIFSYTNSDTSRGITNADKYQLS